LCIRAILLVLSSVLASVAESASLFSNDTVVPVELRIDAAGISGLQQKPREYVRGGIRRGTNLLAETEVRLKGNATFRPITDKASFSLKLSPVAQKQFGGHKRLLLNNSLQDASYLRGKLASEMFLKAGLPTARIGFARVTLNGREMGLYLLVESTDENFLRTHFGSADGNLYEGADQDISAPLQIDSSPNRTDRSDLEALLNACRVEDFATRWSRLGQILDLSRFASFMAMELLVAHKDGYCMDLNNYRLYHDAASGKFIFIAHGMDFTLDNPVLKQDRAWKGAVAKAFIEMPEGRRLFSSV
jgi:spore coat protein CotH